jgi:hypothetical protein
MKRKITKLATVLLITVYCSLFTAFAQVPQAFNYQAIARDNSGNVLANQLILVEVLIHPTDSTTAAVYTENFTVNTNKFGLFPLAIGKGTTPTGVFSSIAWSTGNYWLQVKINLGSGYVNMGSSQLLTVPYAMYAANAGVPGVTGATGPTGAASTVAGPTGATGATGIGIAGGSNGEIQFDSSAAFSGSKNLFWDNYNARLGISTTTPQASLDANSSFLWSNNLCMNIRLTASKGPSLRFLSLNVNKTSVIANNNDGGLWFGVNGAGDNFGSYAMVVQPGGNVGIGTTNPGTTLDIGGAVQISGKDTVAPPKGLSYGMWGYSGVGLGIYSGATSPTQGIGIWTNNGSTKAEVMRVQANGKVGIGTTSPQAGLQINIPDHVAKIYNTILQGAREPAGADPTFHTGILFRNSYWANDTVSGYANITAYDDAVAGGVLTFGTTLNNSGITGTPTTRMVILNNGNVGIGTTSPTSILQVVGLPVYANNAAAIAGGLTVGAFYRTGADPDVVCVVH